MKDLFFQTFCEYNQRFPKIMLGYHLQLSKLTYSWFSKALDISSNAAFY